MIVIDGPDPETTQALNAIADHRLRLIQNPRPRGSAEARNVGVRAAQGEWVAFLDDDDEWLKDKLELQLAVTSPDQFCHRFLSELRRHLFAALHLATARLR